MRLCNDIKLRLGGCKFRIAAVESKIATFKTPLNVKPMLLNAKVESPGVRSKSPVIFLFHPEQKLQ